MPEQNASESVFVRYYREGMAARGSGDWQAAKVAFARATRELQGLIAQPQTPELREKRKGIARQITGLEEDCDKAIAEERPAPEGANSPGESPAAAGKTASPAAVSAASSAIRKGSRENGERSQQRGLDAFRAGAWAQAAIYFRQAAEEFFALSKEGGITDEIRAVRLDRANRLLRKAEECGRAEKEKRRPIVHRRGAGGGASPSEQSSESDGESSAQQWIVKEKPNLKFDDVAGLEKVKQDIRLKMIYPFERPELAAKFGIKPGGGVLMYGPPGTGKTMLAKATAGEIDATFFCISPADVLSKWVGEAEQNIKKLFDAAAGEKRSIIFIDEIEALVPARRDDGSSVMQRVVPQILQGVEGFDRKSGRSVLLMGATNVPWQLDPAMLRPGRFDEKVYIPLPDVPARRKMLDIYLSKRPVAADIDLDALAVKLEGYSGADVKHFCDRAATIPFLKSVADGTDDGEITTEILADVFNENQPSVKPEMLKRFEEWAKASTTG